MFTGLIEEVGTVERIRKRGETLELAIRARKVLEDAKVGDSIAVNGVCLTVVSIRDGAAAMDVMPETFRKTSLHKLSPGDKVNLERAMAAGARFGGHIVQGHADGTGTVRSRIPEGNAVIFEIAPDDPELMRYIVPKGSIAVDGISLTVADAGERSFRVSIIPHTLAETVLSVRKPGDLVNLETDIIGKYVEHLLRRSGRFPAAGAQGAAEASGAAGGAETARAAGGGLTEQFLREHGF
mgnify:CR=1 FL=1